MPRSPAGGSPGRRPSQLITSSDHYRTLHITCTLYVLPTVLPRPELQYTVNIMVLVRVIETRSAVSEAPRFFRIFRFRPVLRFAFGAAQRVPTAISSLRTEDAHFTSCAACFSGSVRRWLGGSVRRWLGGSVPRCGRALSGGFIQHRSRCCRRHRLVRLESQHRSD